MTPGRSTDALAEDPFTYAKLAAADAGGVQQLLARATGNYRRGIER